MEQELSQPFIIRNRRHSRFSLTRQTREESPHRQSLRPGFTPVDEIPSNSTLSLASSLEWERSQDDQVTEVVVSQPKTPQVRKRIIGKKQKWYGTEDRSEKTLNDCCFNLKYSVQKKLYLFNFVMNIIMRIAFINLLVFLGIENKWQYLQIFLSLEAIAVVMYIIVMLKMLFTRSDKESVYFQKIFNEAEWADIQSQRLMRTHFNMKKVKQRTLVFFDPRTKFGQNIKISFLRQQLFKRMQLVMVYIPFMVMFFLNQSDFVTDDKPHFKVWLTLGICIEVLRTTFTYLVIYIYS